MKETDSIKARHRKGIVGIVQSYGLNKIILSIPTITSLLLSILLTFILILNKHLNYHDILVNLTDLVLLVFPSLLGFSLGGYALIIGFGNTSLIKSLTKTKNETDFTIFQRMNGIFAFGLLLQVFVLLLSFIFKITSILELSSDFIFHFKNTQIFNIFGTFLLFWWACWSLIMIPFIVSNVFLFGQMHHFYLTLERKKDEKEKEREQQKELPS